MALAIAVLVAVLAAEGCKPDPCSCYDTGASSFQVVKDVRCDGNAVVTSSHPACGPSCETPTVERMECGTQRCFESREDGFSTVNGQDTASCWQPCASDKDCEKGAYCDALSVSGPLVCHVSRQRGDTCFPGPLGVRCGVGLGCRESDAGDSGSDAGDSELQPTGSPTCQPL